MMSYGIKQLFETPDDTTDNSTPKQEDFLNFFEEKEIDIVYKRSLDIFHNMLRNYDQDLFSYLIKYKIDPTTYMVRWLRCLFCREFSYKVCIQLWDIIFLEEFFQSDNKFQFVDYICIAMYENIKKEIMKNKQEEILKLLFRYPQVDTPFDLIKNAYKIRSFFEFEQYHNQGNKNNDDNKNVKIQLNKNSMNNNIYNNKNIDFSVVFDFIKENCDEGKIKTFIKLNKDDEISMKYIRKDKIIILCLCLDEENKYKIKSVIYKDFIFQYNNNKNNKFIDSFEIDVKDYDLLVWIQFSKFKIRGKIYEYQEIYK